MIQSLRKHYYPIQPTIKGLDKDVRYEEVVPGENLLDLIYCYWQVKPDRTLPDAFDYRVIPDGCIDLFFDLHDPAHAFVMGFHVSHTTFSLKRSSSYVGVRFLPTAFSRLFNIDASELSNQVEELNLISLSVANFIKNRCNETLNLIEIKLLLDELFLSIVSTTTYDLDGRILEAVVKILKSNGVVNIQKDLNTGISSRQLQRLFKHHVGDTAKSLSKVIQFQRVLSLKDSNVNQSWTDLTYRAGYYDQSHFVRDFKRFHGCTPLQAFSR